MSQLNLGTSLILDSDYSTSEVKTGATWIDGKPIYRITVPITLTTIADVMANRTHNIANVYEVIKFNATFYNSTPKYKPCNYWRSASDYCYTDVDRTYINNVCAGDLVGQTGQPVTIWYTKTTD